MRRSIVIGIAAVVVIAAIGLGAWLLLSRSKSLPAGGTGTTGSLPVVGTGAGGASGGKIPGGGSGSAGIGTGVGAGTGAAGEIRGGAPAIKSFGVISNEPALNYFVDKNNNVFIAQPSGKIEEVSGNSSVYLSSSEVNGVISADFSYDGKKVLLGFGNPFAPQWSVFDIASKSWTALSVNPRAAAWSPSDYRIAYFGAAGASAALRTIDTAKLRVQPKTLITLPGEDFWIAWQSPDRIMFGDRPNALFSGSIFAYGVKTGLVSSIVQNRVGLEVQWNASATMGLILAGTELGRGGQLGMIDNGGTLIHQMTFLTLPSKCLFMTMTSTAAAAASQSLICGIPRNTGILSNKPLPDAYDQKIVTTSDDLYSVNLVDGGTSPVFADPSQNLDVSALKSFNGNLFFINRYDQKLYGLSFAQQ